MGYGQKFTPEQHELVQKLISSQTSKEALTEPGVTEHFILSQSQMVYSF